MVDRLIACLGMGCDRRRFRLSFALQKRLAMAMESAVDSAFAWILGAMADVIAGLDVVFGSANCGLGNGRSVFRAVFRCFFCSCAKMFVQYNNTQTSMQAYFISSAFDCSFVHKALEIRRLCGCFFCEFTMFFRHLQQIPTI